MPVEIDTELGDARRISTAEHALTQKPDETMVLLDDYSKLHSALSNLVSNAVQCTPACGRITLNGLAGAEGARFEVHGSVSVCEFPDG